MSKLRTILQQSPQVPAKFDWFSSTTLKMETYHFRCFLEFLETLEAHFHLAEKPKYRCIIITADEDVPRVKQLLKVNCDNPTLCTTPIPTPTPNNCN